MFVPGTDAFMKVLESRCQKYQSRIILCYSYILSEISHVFWMYNLILMI